MLRHATEYYYQTKIARLEAEVAKKEAKILELSEKLAQLPTTDKDSRN